LTPDGSRRIMLRRRAPRSGARLTD
jgi:hypothetical protein